MPKTIVKTPEAYDFLALVPQLVGFLPENSMVLVAFRGKRTCGALRFNLPDPAAPQKMHKRIATTLIGTLCKIPGVDAVVPVTYTDESFAATTGIPHERFAGTLVKRAEMSGFLVRDALCVAADAWGSYLDPRCPAGGHPLSKIAGSTVNAAFPDEARRELATLHSGTSLPRIDLATKERVARTLRRYQRMSAADGSLPELVHMVGDILDPVATTEAALGWDPAGLTAEEAAVLIFLTQSPANRDQMMLQLAFGKEVGVASYELNLRYWALQRTTGRSLDDIVEAEQAAGLEPVARRTSDLMLGLSPDRPDPDRVLRAIDLIKAIVAAAPRTNRPAPLCMLGWLSWALGRGSIGGIFIDQALAIDPHYSMAQLLNSVFRSGHLPEWAYSVPLDETED